MFFSRALFTIAATAAVLVAAIPTPEPAPVAEPAPAPALEGAEVAKRDWPVKLYEHEFFAGAEFDISPGSGYCVNLPSEWNDKVSSVIIEWQCTFFANWDCNPNEGDLIWGAGQYGQMANGLNDRISSFSC